MINWSRVTRETERGQVVYWLSVIEHQSPWLLFLHGLGADHRLFDQQFPHFARRFNVLTWDAPGHCESRPYASDFDYDELAHLLRDILDTEGIDQPVMIGQSMGAFVMQVYMHHFPDLMRGFIAIDSMPLGAEYYRPEMLRVYRKGGAGLSRIPECALRSLLNICLSATGEGRRYVRDVFAQYSKAELCRLLGQGFHAIAQAVETGRDYAITCPALLLCGQRDHAGPTRLFSQKWHALSGIDLKWVPGAGHNSNFDNPGFVNQAIDDFLNICREV